MDTHTHTHTPHTHTHHTHTHTTLLYHFCTVGAQPVDWQSTHHRFSIGISCRVVNDLEDYCLFRIWLPTTESSNLIWPHPKCSVRCCGYSSVRFLLPPYWWAGVPTLPIPLPLSTSCYGSTMRRDVKLPSTCAAQHGWTDSTLLPRMNILILSWRPCSSDPLQLGVVLLTHSVHEWSKHTFTHLRNSTFLQFFVGQASIVFILLYAPMYVCTVSM